MEAPAPLEPPEITSPLKGEPQALSFPHFQALSFTQLLIICPSSTFDNFPRLYGGRLNVRPWLDQP